MSDLSDKLAIEAVPSAKSVDKDINVPNTDTISRQWLMECVNEGWIKFDTEKDENRFIHLVRDIAPSAQLESCEDAVFWRKRAEEYENQCIKLAAEIARNSKFDSVELNDKGIKFTMKQAEHRSLT